VRIPGCGLMRLEKKKKKPHQERAKRGETKRGERNPLVNEVDLFSRKDQKNKGHLTKLPRGEPQEKRARLATDIAIQEDIEKESAATAFCRPELQCAGKKGEVGALKGRPECHSYPPLKRA